MKATEPKTFSIDLFYFTGAPAGAHGIIAKGDAQGSYKIGLNGEETELQNYIAFLHEMTHLYFRDLDGDGNAAEIEKRTHARLLTALRIIEDQDKENQPA
jgi:hypothetical protein